MSRTLDSDGGGQRIDARRVTLADLLAALAVVGLVLAAVLAILEEGQRADSHGAARVETQQTARVAPAPVAREIRQAGERKPAGRRRTRAASAPPTPNGAALTSARRSPRGTGSPPPAARRRPPPALASRSAAPARRGRAPD